MHDFYKQVEMSLLAYHHRGNTVLSLLHQGLIDKAAVVMRARKAALHNFRVADSILGDEIAPFLQSNKWKNLWEQIAKQDKKIELILLQQQKKFTNEMTKVQKERIQIVKYRSRNNRKSTFQQTI